MGFEDSVVFDNPEFDCAIIGVTSDGNVVYHYDMMVSHLMEIDNMTNEEAVEFIDYNTLRAIPYAGVLAPVVMYPIDLGAWQSWI